MSELKIDVHDTLMFRPGMPIVCVTSNGKLVRVGRVRMLIRRAWRMMTWWRWPVSQVSSIESIDGPAGTITLVSMRWSWLRWRWVRA